MRSTANILTVCSLCTGWNCCFQSLVFILQENTLCLKIQMLLYSHQPYIETLSIFLNRRNLILKGFLESRHTPDIHMLMSRSVQGQETVLVSNHGVRKCFLHLSSTHATNTYWSAGNNEELFIDKSDRRPDSRFLLTIIAISWKSSCVLPRIGGQGQPAVPLGRLVNRPPVRYLSSFIILTHLGCGIWIFYQSQTSRCIFL